MKTHTKATAVIVGGGMAGLLAARVLADFYAEVLVIERDELPQAPMIRPGTPQAYHPHRLLERGKMILEALFPGYENDLLAQGAYSRENKFVQIINQYGSLMLPDEAGASSSRALLEWTIRQRVQQFANVRFMASQEVTGLLTGADQTRVTGLHLRGRGDEGERRTVMADLVVDASGRSSKLVRWLHALGYVVPEPERIKLSLGYSTRRFLIPAHLRGQVGVIWIEGDAARGIGGGVLSPIEDGIAELVFDRAGGASYPSVDGNDTQTEAAKLLDPRIADVIPMLEPLGEPRGFRVLECLRYHFEQMEHWPAGLLVIGDAICNFDPIFGQGITVAAMEAEVLATCLQEEQSNPSPNFEQKVLQRMQAAIEPAWWLSAVADLRWAGVEYVGAQPLKGVVFAQKFIDLLLEQIFAQGNMQVIEPYFMMTTLFVSPREVMTAEMVNTLLAADTTGKAQQLHDEFLGGKGRSLEEILDQILPAFAPVEIPVSALAA